MCVSNLQVDPRLVAVLHEALQRRARRGIAQRRIAVGVDVQLRDGPLLAPGEEPGAGGLVVEHVALEAVAGRPCTRSVNASRVQLRSRAGAGGGHPEKFDSAWACCRAGWRTCRGPGAHQSPCRTSRALGAGAARTARRPSRPSGMGSPPSRRGSSGAQTAVPNGPDFRPRETQFQTNLSVSLPTRTC